MKKIHILGTSFSVGGGLDWGTPGRNDILHHIYKFVDEPKTIDNYSWPGQMKRLIKDNNVEIINHAKCGFGNELIYRKIFEITQQVGFKKEDNLFLIEWSYFGRKEFYSQKYKDYFIVNYNESDMKHLSFSFDYQDFSFNQEYNEKNQYLNKLKKSSREFLDETLYYNANTDSLHDLPFLQNISFFVSFLKLNKINYLYTSPPVVDDNQIKNGIETWFVDKNNRVENIKYKMEGEDEEVESFVAFFNMPEHEKYRLHITGETHGMINDLHLGLWGAKIVAQQTYNRLVDDGWIIGEKAEFPEKPIINLEAYKQ